MDAARKTGINAGKTASKRVVQITAETTGDLNGCKIANKTTSVSKTKSKEKEDETNKRQEIYILLEERQQIMYDLRLLQTLYKNGIPKNYKPIRYNITLVPRSIT